MLADMANILVFRGNLQNQGNIWALEFNNEILIMGSGIDNPIVSNEPIDIDYLKEKKNKIKCFFAINSSPKNSGSIEKIYNELELEGIPIYGTKATRLAFEYIYNLESKIISNFIEVDDNLWSIDISNKIKASFILLDSNYIGTIALRIYDEDHCVYYLEDFSFNVLSNNSILFNPLHFMNRLRKFFSFKKKRTCLVTGCQSLGILNNGSIFSEFKKVFSKGKKIFLIVYDFDFLHIIEAFEIAQKLNINVNVLNENMFKFLSEIFIGTLFSKIMRSYSDQDELGIYLLTLNFKEIVKEASEFITEGKNQTFIYCLFPMSGAEGRIARLADFLHSFNNEFVDLSRKMINIGTNFYDLKLILRNLNPNVFILLQNSYKNSDFLEGLKHFKPKLIPNKSILNITASKKLSKSLMNAKKSISTDNLLFLQREKLFKSGLLVIFININLESKKLHLSKLKTFSLSISETVDLLKLEKKMINWWETKIITGMFNVNSSEKNLKSLIEKRLSGLVKNYLSFENDIDIGDPLFLIYIGNQINEQVLPK
ncbi:MAG TPA: hypothetical protein VN854_01440 [Mycoplasmatales bacterium]|jgi:hypothetical protein|nr:hypothetical protein [Mycoplasmatales bacterium]